MKKNHSFEEDVDSPRNFTDGEQLSITSGSGGFAVLGQGKVKEISDEESSNQVYRVEFNEQNMRWSDSSTQSLTKQNTSVFDSQIDRKHPPRKTGAEFEPEIELLEKRISELEDDSYPAFEFANGLIQHRQVIPYTLSILLMMVAYHYSSILAAVCGGILLVGTGVHYEDGSNE